MLRLTSTLLGLLATLLFAATADHANAGSGAELRDGKLLVDGEPLLKRSAYFGYNTWTASEKNSVAPFVIQPLSQVGSSTDFYTQAGFNIGHYAVHPQWLGKTPFDPTLLGAAIERAKKAGQKITLNIWVTVPESVAESFDMHWINDEGKKIPFGKILGMHHNPEVHAAAMVETYKDLFDFIRNEPTVIDVQIGGERWPYDYVRVEGDISYDDYSLEEFRKYLKERFTLAEVSQRYGNKADFYADWGQVFPPVSKRPMDFGKRELANYNVARWDWYNFRKAQTVKVWVALIEALQKLDGTGRPMYHEYGHGPYYSMGFGPFQEVCAKTKNFSVGNGDFQVDLAGMLSYAILQKGCGEGPWINNELDAGCHGHHVDAAYMRRHIWGNLAAGITGYNIWTFINLQGFPYEFQNVNYSPGRMENQPPKYFETQHSNKMLESLGSVIADSTPPKPAVALLLLDDAIFHYNFALSYHQDGNNVTRAMAANGYADQFVLYTEYQLDHTNLEGITTIFMPRTQRITEARAAKLAEFVKRGGNLVLMGPTGRVDELFKTYEVYPYGVLGEVAGVEVRNLSADELTAAPMEAKWGEELIRMDVTTALTVPSSSKAKVLASVEGKPMVTMNEYGKGRCYFLAGYPFLLDDADATGHLLANVVRTAGTAPAASLQTDGKVNNGIFAGHRWREHGPLLMLIENADRAHYLDVTLDPAALGLNAGSTYRVFELFSEESHTVSAGNGWKFQTKLEPVGVRVYLVTTEASLDAIIPPAERMLIGRGPDTVYVEKATREQPYRASDILSRREEYVRGFIVDAADVKPGQPMDLGGGFSALDLSAYAGRGLNTMMRHVPNLLPSADGQPGLLATGPNRELGDVPVLVPEDFVLCEGEVRGIPVGKKSAKLHFFHGGNLSEHRSVLGYYRVHYADGSLVPVPIVYGTTLSDFSRSARFPAKTKQIWSDKGRSLTRYDWINPKPDQEIDRIDIVHVGRKNEEEGIRVWAITAQGEN
jgi:hypothetical protein